ncbi:hypothetical protein [Tunturibacter empetritectus]|uniref:Uncharacterized protein n=1 Tax=Tunturiibacter lichenicola TaxID=2051959 RepID=A0A7W8JBB7_9BACT|nr:hypothetical protein [Edaphobacter lichenicola]MBB5346155.1 hypothetical protein [Edaphobacter lichenicola]
MINDRALKATSLRYIVAKGYFPQLEVVVAPDLSTGAGSRKKGPALTDVDVLGLIPDDFVAFRKLLIDCKTLKNQSPISRAFWMRGLMDEMKAERGLCVMRGERIEPDHRISAARLGVMLLTEEEFEIYIKATSTTHLLNAREPHSTQMNLWELFLDLRIKYPPLEKMITFSTVDFWQFTSAADALRANITLLRGLRGELDPSKLEHKALVLDACALMAISLSEVVHLIFASYLLPKTQAELSEALLMVLYGGKGNYETLNSLRKLLRVSTESPREDLTLPEWERFVQLVRETLESPLALGLVPLLLRECAWSYLGDGSTAYAMTLASQNLSAGKYALLACEYLCEAAKLPPEFRHDLSSMLLGLQMVHN